MRYLLYRMTCPDCKQACQTTEFLVCPEEGMFRIHGECPKCNNKLNLDRPVIDIFPQSNGRSAEENSLGIDLKHWKPKGSTH